MSTMSPVASSGAPSTGAWSSVTSATDCAPSELSGACALLALMVKSQGATENGSRTDVELNAKKLEELKQQLADAIQHAKDASEHSGFLGFLSDPNVEVPYVVTGVPAGTHYVWGWFDLNDDTIPSTPFPGGGDPGNVVCVQVTVTASVGASADLLFNVVVEVLTNLPWL